MQSQISSFEQQDDELDLSELFSILWARKWFIFLFVVLCCLLSVNYILKQPDRFSSSVLIMFKESKSNADALQNIMTSGLTAAENTETELELLKSRRFAGQIVDNLELTKNTEYVTPINDARMTQVEKDTKERSIAIERFMSNMKVGNTSGTNLVKVSYDSYSATHAALVANEIAQTIINFKQELLEEKNQDRSAWLETKLSGVKKSLTEAESKIVQHQNENDFIDINSALELEKTKLDQLTREQYQSGREIEKLTLLKKQILQYEQHPEELLSIPDFAASIEIKNSRDQLKLKQEEFSKVKLRYGPKHPAYQKAELIYEEAKASVVVSLQAHMNLINKRLDNERIILANLESESDAASKRLRSLGVIEFDYQKLRREFDANLELYENLVKRLKESDMMQDMANASNVLIVEQAEVANRPNSKKEHLIIVLTALLSGFVASTLVLIEAILSNKIIQFRKVAAAYNTRVLGIIPKIKVKGVKGKPLYELDINKHMNFYEALRSTRTNIMLDNELSTQKVIAVTSISPNDGKTSLSIQLAASFAELEKVALIDADLRFPSIGEALKHDINHPGLTNLIAKRSKLQDCISKETRYEFDVLTAGFRAKNPLLYLSQPRLRKIIQYFKQNYDRVVLECPPVMSVSDAFVISKHVDSIYLVVDIEKTNKAQLVSTLEELQQANVKVGGILLNKAKNAEQYYNNAYYKHTRSNLNGVKFAY